MSGVLDYPPDESEAIFEARDEYLADRADRRRELASEDADPMGGSWCGCGVQTPNCYCPGCGARLRPPGSAGEIRWMRNHGYAPTADDLRRFPD